MICSISYAAYSYSPGPGVQGLINRLFDRIFWKFWYQSIRKTLENGNMLRTEIKQKFEKNLHDDRVQRLGKYLGCPPNYPFWPLFFSERFWTDVSKFNVSIGLCALAFAAEMTLFLTSAYLAIRARANSLVRLENEEIDALLQGKNFTLN